MNKGLARFSALLLFGVCFGFLSAPSAGAHPGQVNPTLIHEAKNDRSQPLRDLAASAQSVPSAAQQTPFPQRTGSAISSSQPDPVAQVASGGEPVSDRVRVGLNFDGLSAADTVASGGPFDPPDSNGEEGEERIVERVNETFIMFDASSVS